MPNFDIVELVILCKSWQEAQDIADVMLTKKLVKTVETVTASRHWWLHQIGQGNQVKFILATPKCNEATVKREIKILRHGDRRPPYSISAVHLSHEVTKWLRSATEVKSDKLNR